MIPRLRHNAVSEAEDVDLFRRQIRKSSFSLDLTWLDCLRHWNRACCVAPLAFRTARRLASRQTYLRLCQSCRQLLTSSSGTGITSWAVSTVCQTPVLFAAGPAVRGGPREPKQRGTSAGSSVASLVEAIRSGDDGRWCERYSQSQEIQEPVLSRALCLDHAQPLEVSRHGRCLAAKRDLCHHQQAHEDVFPSVCPLVSASAFLTVDFIHGSRVVLFAVICQCGLNQRLCGGLFV